MREKLRFSASITQRWIHLQASFKIGNGIVTDKVIDRRRVIEMEREREEKNKINERKRASEF